MPELFGRAASRLAGTLALQKKKRHPSTTPKNQPITLKNIKQ